MTHIKEVTVTVHEKRNHPYEFGHFDCSISLVAELPDLSYIQHETMISDRIAELRAEALAHVQEECDRWELEQHRDYNYRGELGAIRACIHRISYVSSSELFGVVKNAIKHLEEAMRLKGLEDSDPEVKRLRAEIREAWLKRKKELEQVQIDREDEIDGWVREDSPVEKEPVLDGLVRIVNWDDPSPEAPDGTDVSSGIVRWDDPPDADFDRIDS